MKNHLWRFNFLLYFLIVVSTFANEQVVITYIDSGLKQSSNYELTGVATTSTLKALRPSTSIGRMQDGHSLDSIVEFGWSSSTDFAGTSSPYSYSGSSENKYVVMPMVRNTDTLNIQEGKFLLSQTVTNSQTNEDVKNIYIDETFHLPASAINLVEDTSYTEGNRFTYSENQSVRVKHLEVYKRQEYLIRITKGTSSKQYDIYGKKNPIAIVNNTSNSNKEYVEEFLEGSRSYVDFRFNGDFYDKVNKVTTDYGLGMTFIPGKLELFGLPQGDYSIEIYSFRYTSEYSNEGSLVISLEDTLNFQAKGLEQNQGINLLNFYSGKAPEIEAVVLTVSNSSSSAITVKEEIDTDTKVDVNNLDIAPMALTKVYTSSGAINLDATGYDANSNKYYKKWSIKYTSNILDRLDKDRKVFYILDDDLSGAAKAEYKVDYSLPPITEYPHQTVMATFTPDLDWGNNKYEIKDRVMPKQTFGYKEIKATTVVDMNEYFRGQFVDNFTMVQDHQDYLWDGGTRVPTNGVVFRKPISDSKGSVVEVDGSNTGHTKFTFYTTKSIDAINYVEAAETGEPGDKATFNWSTNTKSSHGVIVSEDKVIFRIVKLAETLDSNGNVVSTESPTNNFVYDVDGQNYTTQLPIHYYNHYEKTNIIGSGDEIANINDFVAGNSKYVDLVFDSGLDREVEGGNAVFTFSKDNSLQIIGLPRGSYIIQIYSLQDADSDSKSNNNYDYRVLTYGGFTPFKMGLPTIVTGEFANQNNLFMIDSINLHNDYDIANDKPIKRLFVNFVTKAEQSLNLQLENLVARLDEEGGAKATNNNVTEQREGLPDILPVTNLALSKSEKADFQFPLDVVFLIDNSGSMQNEIDSVKAGLKEMTTSLEARGFDVKYNLITFGPNQNSSVIGSTWNSKVEKYDRRRRDGKTYYYMAKYKDDTTPWFNSVTELEGAFGDIRASSGYYRGEENGAWAIKYGKEHLVDNGRFLDFNNAIVSNSSKKEGYIPSAKWLILLTDENMDVGNLPGSYVSSTVINALAKELTDNSIKLTGIIHTDTYTDNRDIKDKYLAKIPNSYVYSHDDGEYRIKFTDRIGNLGVKPADIDDKFYTEFMLQLKEGEEAFQFYEMGSSGQYVGSALSDAVGNIGIVQRWVMSYDSPFPESDGFEREVIFSLTDIPKASATPNVMSRSVTPTPTTKLEIKPFIRAGKKDRYYRVPEQKIEAYFKNPDPQKREIIAKDNYVVIEAMARSEYKDSASDLINYEVKDGQFTIYGNKTLTYNTSGNGDGGIKVIKEEVNDGSRWFKFYVEIPKVDFEAAFGKTNLKVEFIASTNENSIKIAVDALTLVEKDPPKIKSITLTNDSLAGILNELKAFPDESDLGQIDETFITSNSSITINASNGAIDVNDISALNVKANDKISVKIVVEEENEILFDSTPDSGTTITLAGLPLKSISVTGTSSEKEITGIVNLPSSSLNDKVMVINLVDVGGNRNPTPTIINNILEVPVGISGTTFKANIDNDGYTNYYSGQSDKAALTVNTATESEALLYLFIFNHNRSESDKLDNNSYENVKLGLDTKIIPSKDVNYMLMDGKYEYPVVYIMNKAGKITEFDYVSLEEMVSKGIEPRATKPLEEFWVDTVAPEINIAKFIKTYEGNATTSEIISKFNSEFTNGIIDENYFKNSDKVKLLIEGKEKNPRDEIIFSNTNGLDTQGASNNGITTDSVFNVKIEYGGYLVTGEPSGEITFKDRAGNVTISASIDGTYDANSPSLTEIAKERETARDSNKYKFIKLTEAVNVGGVFSVVKDGSYYGTREKTDVVLADFIRSDSTSTGYVPTEGKKDINTYSFTSSGAISIGIENVVVDKSINHDSDKFYGEAVYKSNGIYTGVEIDFSQIKEYVGLRGFRLESPSGDKVNKIKIGSTEITTSLDNEKVLIAKENPVINPTTFTYSEKVEIDFTHNSPTDKVIKIKLTDKLGNEGIFDYIIRINQGTKVIGRSTKSTKEEISHVEISTSDNMDIKAKK